MLVRPFVSRVCLFLIVSLPACDCLCRRLSAKLVPTFTDIGCHVVSVTIHKPIFSDFYIGAATFSSKKLLNCTHEAE
jgi:hypothetical protein